MQWYADCRSRHNMPINKQKLTTTTNRERHSQTFTRLLLGHAATPTTL
jgi:hypothetical protein